MATLGKLLHVEDDPDIREIVKLALSVSGELVVEQCESGPMALAMAPQFRPDLYLLDSLMPEMSGEKTWLELQKLRGLENVPAIFMTAKARAVEAKGFLELGALCVITKPFDPMSLQDEIQSAWNNFHR